MTNYNEYPVTAEEVEAMDALCRLGAGVPLTQDSSVTVKGMTMELQTNIPQPTLESIVQNICTQLQLLTTVISQAKAQPHADDQSLQTCVDAVLEQSNWFAERVEKEVADFINNEIDIGDECNDKIGECVDNYFSYEFSLTDHCDIDDIVADKLDDRLEDIVQERLQEMLSTATITFNN